MQADGVVQLLADIEAAVAANNSDDFLRLTAASLPPADRTAFVSTSFAEGQTSAAVRERDRRPDGAGYSLMTEMLIGRGMSGRIATWQLRVQPKPDEPGRYVIAGATPIASVDGLVQLQLDTSTQYTPRNLVFSAEGLTLQLSSGAVFLVPAANSSTALLFRGKGTMRFAPPDPAEQVQVRAFGGKPALESDIDFALIRINPGDFDQRIRSSQLVPTEVNTSEAAKARAVFDQYSGLSYTLNLGDLTSDRWSLLPPAGDVLAELHTKRFGTLTYLRSTNDPEDVSLFDRARGRNISVYASAGQLAMRGRYYSEDDTAAYDVLHYDVDVRFDPDREWISGKGSLLLKTRREAMTTLSIKLAEPLNVSSVSSPTLGRVLALRVAGRSSILVSLNRPLPMGTEVQLDLSYSGKLPGQNIEREALTVTQGAQQIPNPFAPDRLIPPEPRYLYSNRSYWYPQAPVSDYATASLRLTVPAQYQVVGSGNLVSSVVTPIADETGRAGDEYAERAVRFEADAPIRYLACIISRFVPIGQAQARVPPTDAGSPARAIDVDVVATPRLQRSNRDLPGRVASMLEYFSDEIGDAPYRNFSLATLDAELPSGHSPAYFAVWNQAVLPTNLVWRADPVSLDGHPLFVLAHEVAHQWWGQAIGWKNYHEQWLSEGLAQYFAARWAGHDRGNETERDMFAEMRNSAVRLSRNGPIYLGYRLGHVQNDARIFRGLIYNKAAVVVDMLRRFIGPDAFSRGIQRFYRDNRFEKAGTDDFIRAFQAETSQPLDRFFDQWVHGFVIPEVRLNWRMVDDTHLSVRVEQQGDTFDFPLTLTIQHASGRTEQVTLAVTAAGHDFVIPVEAPVRRVDTRDDTSLVTVKR